MEHISLLALAGPARVQFKKKKTIAWGKHMLVHHLFWWRKKKCCECRNGERREGEEEEEWLVYILITL